MKKLFFMAMTFLLLMGCSQEEIPMTEETQVVSVENDGTTGHHITLSKAMAIASKCRGGGATRFEMPPQVDYVISDEKTRALSDTLAYIFNYEDNGGFIMVSSDDRVYPILARSDKGHLSYEESEDDIVYANFIRRLRPYIESVQDSDESVEYDEDLDGCVVVLSQSTTKWNQRSPYDKYVIQEHPGCPVGCVAVAIGQIMANCKDGKIRDYHGVKIDAELMSDAFSRMENGLTENPNYPFSVALDDAAKLVYYIGKDVNMTYTKKGSTADYRKALDLLKSLNYQLSTPTFQNYDASAVAKLILQKNLIYMRGEDEVNGNHAWVADGVQFCYATADRTPSAEIENILIYCNWGWGDDRDGYYQGDVFSPGVQNFINMKYIAVSPSPFSMVM